MVSVTKRTVNGIDVEQLEGTVETTSLLVDNVANAVTLETDVVVD